MINYLLDSQGIAVVHGAAFGFVAALSRVVCSLDRIAGAGVREFRKRARN